MKKPEIENVEFNIYLVSWTLKIETHFIDFGAYSSGPWVVEYYTLSLSLLEIKTSKQQGMRVDFAGLL